MTGQQDRSVPLLPCTCDHEDGHSAECRSALPLMQALDLLTTLTDAATPGPWKVETCGGYITGHVTAEAHDYAGNTGARRDSVTHPDSMTQVDAEFIAVARHAVPALIALLKRADL